MKSHLLAIAALSLASFPLAACSKKGDDASTTTATAASANGTATPGAPGVPAPKGGSCMQDKAGLCTEFDDNALGMAESLCSSLLKGAYSKAGCTRENTVGSCRGKSDTTYYYFGNSSGPWTEDAADDCKTIHEGTFAATPGAAETAKQKALPRPDQILASCQHPDGLCDDYYGDPLKAEINKAFCEGSGTYVEGKACPTDGVVASCLAKGGLHRYTAAYLKKSMLTLNDVSKLCEGGSIGFSHFYPAPGATPPAAMAGGKAIGTAGKNTPKPAAPPPANAKAKK